VSAGYERSDARPGPILAAGLVLCAVAGLVVWGASALFWGLQERALRLDGGGGHARHVDEPPTGPRLQARPALELAEHRALEARRTEEYAWIDRSEALVRVPVERAMELLLERGLPVRSERAPDGGEAGR